MEYREMNKDALEARLSELRAQYEAFQKMQLSLNMARGKPGKAQLELSDGLFSALQAGDAMQGEDKMDIRNYGVLTGIGELKQIFADLLGVKKENVILGGGSSLNLMFDYISQCMTHGVCGGSPWFGQKIKFLCPVPGYDRHFGILEYFGIEMLPVEVDENGPDMDMIESLVRDPSVKGMFCVPKYSNPGGVTFSDETVDRIARLQPAAEDFRIIWDNAYAIHDVSDTPDTLREIFSACKQYGTEDHIIEVASFAKVTFPGACVSCIIASDNNLAQIEKRLSYQIINYDKVNQMRHVVFFKDADGVLAHMKKHAAILKPKFDAVLHAFSDKLGGKGIAEWTKPNGGYFISLNVMDGCAKRVVSLCKDAGLVLTGAGATYPKKNDPRDRNIRIAPTFPSTEELLQAMDVLCVCVELASLEKLLNK
ncbi:MAG: aminotransferase [Clostridia bacterium]|nr:aminotransferase [Clostridia bacterium]